MAPLSLKIVLDNGVVTRTVLFDTRTTVKEANDVVIEKFQTLGVDHNSEEYGLFLTSADYEKSGIWLESHRTLDFYMLRDGDSLQYICKMQKMKVKMLDGSVKTVMADVSKVVGDMLFDVCTKFGITNYDEYGLCHDEAEDPEEVKPATGTLTLKRKNPQRERDVRLEQMSKKLKTDDNVEWLDQKRTLRELKVDPEETLLLKRRLFYSDRKIDARDPVQLNLLYVQTRENILSGRQIVTEEKAAEFAGIQCQIDFGDFEEDKHKPGFIENLTEYLPLQYTSSWGIEKKIYREYSKHKGLSQVDAKYLYTKIAREFPTYGVTFFLVKERQKNKKKLIPRLLGINAKSILRLDENTKEILQVWRITQVQSYHAGNATFTLNFGDYSDKEYSVKTNEAFRIRDILEGYIDIIRKQREGPSNISYVEGAMICEDNVEKSKGHVIQAVEQQSVKVVEQSFVGPSKIISYEPGQQLAQGTQIVTVQQMIITNKENMKQKGMNSETPRSHMLNDFARILNRVNSESVNAVMLLSDPSPSNLQQVRTIANRFVAELPTIVEGVEELAKQQNTEEERKRLLDELDELCKYLNSLGSVAKRSDLEAPENLQTAEKAAKKVAELSTQVMFSLDPKSRRRSEFLRRSRQSFIADERMEATLRRASFLTIASTGCGTLKHAINDLENPYAGPEVNKDNAARLEGSAVNKIGRLNAAVALLLAARADPKNIDYETAINSMTAINELTPLLIKDAKALSSTKDDKNRRELLNKIRDLCETLNNLCAVAGTNTDLDIKNAANNYGKTSGKLIYLFNPKSKGGKRGGLDPDKENEIVDLAKDVGNKTNALVKKAKDLVSAAGNDRRAQVLDAAGAKSADAAKSLLACSQLVAPTIHERHCQSALTATSANLSSSVHLLSQAWKPLVEEQKYQNYGKKLGDKTADLMNALDRLNKAYSSINSNPPAVVDNHELSNEAANMANERKRLQFIASLSTTKQGIREMERELQENCGDLKSEPIKDNDEKEKLRQILSQKVAQLNAATASLLHATSKGKNPDYDTATLAMNVINEVTPEMIADTKSLAKYENENIRKDMLEEVTELCKAMRNICDSAEKNNVKDINEAAANFANSSGKLCYVFNPRTNPVKENEILDLSRSACEKASEMLSKVYQLTEAVGGEDGARLDSSGANVVTAAQTLLLAAQITAPSITDARCQSALITTADTVSEQTQDLSYLWEPIIQNSEHQALGDQLEKDREDLEAMLEKLRNACKVDNDEISTKVEAKPSNKERIQFKTTTAAAKRKLDEAEKLLQNSNDTVVISDKANKPSSEHKELQRLTAQKLAELNAAIAALVQATSDPVKPDYITAEMAITTISEVTPDIVQYTNKLSEYTDDKQRRIMLDNVRALCKANKLICDSMDNDDFTELSNAANKFSNTSGKLYYVFNPRANSARENQILELSKAACEKASEMLSIVYELAEEIGGESGSRLDSCGSRVVDSAQALLSVAQITSPSMTDSLCRSALISSADKVSDMSQELASTWEPIVQQQKYQAVGANLENGRQRLESVLEKLKNICRPENDKPSKPEIKPRDTTRLKFIKTTSAVKKQMDDVEKLLLNNEDVLKMPNKLNKDSSEHKELQRRSAQKLAELNAAIAALVRATSDSANPDFITAEGAINTISQLTPEIVQNTNKLCEYADDQQRLEMLNNIRSLCNANKLICDSLENNDFKELKDSANKFANSSGQLCVVFNPRANPIQENLILDLSEQACEKTAKLLSQVYELAEKVGGEDGHKLDRSGARVADSAQALITTAQLTAPTMNNDQCRSEMIRSADTVSSLTQDLACVWEPIVQNPNHQALGGQLIKDRDILEAVLEKLRNACKPNNDKPSKPEIKPRDSTQLKFIKTTSAVKKQMDDVEKLIVNNENAMKMPHKINRDSSEHKELQRRFAQKLAELNAAIAALVRATSDSANPDYITAEGAINTISQLTPEIVQNTNKLCEYADDQKRLEMLNNIRSLCNANKLICDSLEKNDFKELKDSANKFANSSGQLCVVFNPRANPIQENLILDLSEQACEKTAKLLSQVYELAEKVGGEDGHKLDRSGARVADSAQALITTAQLTAPTMNNDQCRSEMITSADAVSSLTQDLACVWEPIVQNPNHQALGGQLNKDRDILEAVLEKLRNACKPNNDKPSKPEIKPRDSTQLKFIKTTSAVKKQMDDVEKLIVNNENAMKMPHKINRDSSEHKELQRRSAQKLAELNAAIAALVRATSDSANPDYITAEGAINTISQLTPEMVQNTNKLCEYADDQQRLEMLNNIRSLCNANKLICDSLEKNDFKELKDSANKFANSSGQLCVVFNPRANPIQENLILDLSEQACEKTAKLLSHVYELAEKVGGEDGYKLDRTGARVADSAQALMTTAQLTAPTMNNDQCRSEMITSADAVSSLTQDLACVWEPIVQNPNHQALGGQLNKDRDILEAVLEKLRNACKPNNDKPSKPEIKPRDSTQLKFIKTTSAVKKQMDDVEKLILNNENAMKMPHKINRDSSEHKELQRRFAQKLAELNAAIAALVRATSDSANPDYITAEGAINTISQLTPEIVQNTNKLCEYADDQQRLEMLNNIRSLCNANKLICDSLEKNDFKELKDSANKFANSSGQLCVVFNPRANPIQENLILDLSEQACEKTAKLLSHVYKLAEKVGGENGYKLDRTGARVADSAQALMTTAQLTAPTMNNDQCRSEMIRSADAVSNLTQDLACVWEPIVQNPNHQALGGQLNKDREILEAVLEKLRNACKPNNETTEKEKQRPKFITITSTAKKQLDEAEHLLLNSADIAMKPKTLKINALAQRELQFESAQKLGELNAAIANLVRAASDGGDLDYNTAEQTIMTISKLTPEIIQNTTKLCEYADKEQSKAMLDNVKEICNANKIICDRVEGNDYKELNDAATNYSKPSGLLCSLFNQRVHPVHENKILDLSEEVCRKSSGMLAGVYELAEQVGGESGFTLDRSGAKVADATQALLTIAQIVTPTIPADRCQSAMIASADSISGLSQKLVSTWEPIVKDPKYQSLGGRLNNDRKMLEIALEKLRNACNDTKEREKKRHEFISTMPAAIKKLVDAEELIKQNNDFVMDNKLTKSSMEHEEVQRRAAEKLAELNAAQAALAQATSDAANQDYKAAQSAIMTIAQLTPEIVQNTNKLCEYENEEQRQVMLDNVRDICKANKLVCESLEHANIKELNLAAIKFAKSSAKLYYIFDQTATPMRHNQILDLTKASCEKSSAMMSNVYELAETAGGREGSIIEESTVKVVDGAQALLIVAQLTAPSIDDGKCKTALITSANNLSSLTEDLSAKLAPIVQDPKHSSFGEKLVKDGKEFDENLEKLIAACNTKPAVRPKKPAPPTRHQSLSGDDKLKATKNIHFCKSVDVVQDNITRAEEQVKKAYNQKSLPPTIVGEQEKLQDLMEKNLALAGVTVAQLISDMSPHHVNYDNAIKCTKVLAEIFPEIVKAGTELGNAKEDIDKKEFLGDLLSLCEASTKLCNTAKNDTQNLNTVAIDFGDKAAKLLYKVSAEIDPTQEKEVIHRAKEIGDSASRLAVRGAEGADAADARAHALCAAGARCADAASELMYTAKLVAPSIHDPESQKALLDVSNQLSSKSNEFMLTWQPFSSNPEHMTFVMELDAEAKQLKSLLANFKQDLKDNKMVRRRILEDETVQDTPLRQLASNILETAKRKAETSSCPEERRNHNNYSSKLAAAIKDLDLANARCRNSPRDIQRREELEEAVQHLQQICLESRIQSASGDQNRFVDLMDLINDVSSDAKQLSDETSNVKAVHNKDAIIIIKDEADDIIKEAKEATKPNVSDDGGAMDDIMIIKQFAEKCDDRVNALLKVIEEIHEEPYKTALRDKLIHLKGSSDMLRFAVNSHIAAASSAALDMNMVDFDELEKNIDNILQSTRKTKNIDNEKESAAAAMATATTLCSAVAYRNAAEKIPPALAAYLLETRSKTDLSDPKQKYKLEEHLKKLIHLLQTQALASSRRIATWQEADDGEIAEITHQIIQEIESFNKDDNDEVQKSTDIDVVTESDLKKLLLPSKGAVVRGNQKELSHQLSQHMQKLGSMASMVQLGVGRRESLARTLHALADVAMQLALIARSVPTHDPITKMRIEDATQTMCSTTYNLLKTAEVASQDPQHPDTHRRLHEACRLLNESITKLSRVTLPEDRMQRDCGEIARNLQLQLGLLQTDYPTCSMTYAACLKPLENQNNLQSLQSEEPMSREECSAHLQYLSSMVCHSAEYAAQCGYLLSLPEEHQYIAKEGFLNVPRIRNITGEIRLACLKIIRSKFVEDANYSQSDINKYIIELQEVTQEAAAKMRDPHVRKEVSDSLQEMECASKDLREALTRGPGEMNTITPLASRLLDATEDFSSVTTHLAVPSGIKPSAEKKARSEEVINYAKTLIIKTQALVKQVGSSDHEVLTWKMFAIGKQGVTTAYEDFVCSIIENGRRAGFTEVAEKKEEAPKKTFIEIQLDLANKWLTKPASKPEVKTAGIEGVRNIIELAEKVSEDMKGEEKVDMQGMVDESKELLEQCVVKYNSEKASLLMERLKELHKMLTWRVVTRVVEDFLEDEPLEDLDIIADSETDEKKRKYILDKKIAELLAQLGRVKKTARFVADAGSKVPSEDLIQTKDQVELLAPALVKAAQKRIETPNNMEAVNNYKKLLAEYNQSMARIREICDRSVDPVDFAQAAGDTIQRMREESTAKNDPQTCTTTSRTITRLGLRVIEAGLCSQEAKNDPELKQALSEARSRLTATTTLRSSRVPDWRDITAEILRTTGEVESFLGGENIFQKQPEPNQPIYAAALDLHATVREWSARDNEIVAVAKRMAVQMARLSEHMNSDRKSELLATSKKIVAGSHQVAALARKLALECTDMRIRTNLLQVCDRIPTISGQLKMLITVKGSSLGQQGSEEDKEAMNTLIGNAQNLMSSIQEVVKAAIGASVKIMSQRGPRMKWVRRNYYQY